MASTALELLIKINTLGTDELKKVDAVVKSVGEGTRLAGAQLKTFDATLASLVATGKTTTQALEEMAASSGVLSASIRSTAAEVLAHINGVNALGAAHKHAVTDVQAASAAIRSFEGHIPIRAVEQFTVKMLGLGPIMQAAFPVIGVIASVEAVGQMIGKVSELYNKWDPITKAETEALEVMKKLNSEYAKLGADFEKRRYDIIEKIHGKSERYRAEASDIEGDAKYADARAISDLEAKIKKENGRVQAGTSKQFGDYGPSVLNADAQAARAKLTGLEAELENAQLRERDHRERAADLRSKATEEDKRKIEEAQRKAIEAGRAATQAQSHADDESLARLKASHELSVGEVIRYWQERLDAESGNADRVREITIKLGNLYQERDKLLDRVLERGRRVQEQIDAKTAKRDSFLSQMAVEAEESVERVNRAMDAVREKHEEHKRRAQDIADQTDVDAAQRAFSRAQRLIELSTPSAGPGGAARREASIIEQSYRNRLDIATQLLDIETRKADRITDDEKKQEALAEARRKADDLAGKAREDREIRLLELQKKSLDQYKQQAGKIFDAITSRNPGQGLKNLAIGEAKNIGRNAFEAVVGPMLGSLGGILGIGGSPTDQAALKTEQHTKRIADNTDKLLSGGASGIADIGLSSGGNAAKTLLGSIQSSLSGSGLAGLFGNGSGGNFNSGLGSVLSGNALATVLGQNTTGTTTLAGRIGAGVGLGGALLAGGMGIASGIRQGGVGGDLKAAGSAAGLTGALVGNIATLMKATGPLLSAIPVVGSIAALALPLLGGLIGSNPEKRAKEIQKELALASFQAPVALNVTQDGSGHYTDFDARGNIRKSLLSAIPQVEQPYIERLGGGWSGRPVTYQNVPGRVDSPFGAPAQQPVVQHIYNFAPGSVQAIDTQSFDQAIQKARASVSNAVASDLEGNEGRLAAAIRYKVGR
ncbi:hypothetical protein UFOVP130_46 [uncultured Caudovirales phage]|uniref:Uncharacterized protein n=1 Tax=uncultured Caudovirales phage TaxID=2100421 RepID=A0A6J5LCN6_9CAUD|nr:hypothetical protein UFOVP130_46 [uncultured Caudovirales phage]